MTSHPKLFTQKRQATMIYGIGSQGPSFGQTQIVMFWFCTVFKIYVPISLNSKKKSFFQLTIRKKILWAK